MIAELMSFIDKSQKYRDQETAPKTRILKDPAPILTATDLLISGATTLKFRRAR